MQQSRRKLIAFSALLVGIVSLLAFVVAEMVARVLEPERVIHGYTAYPRHPVLGWLPPLGKATIETNEFVAHYDVNALGMNDRPVEETRGAQLRILALGDSHTFAVGVSRDEAWPNVLETLLSRDAAGEVAVYNAGVVGYSLGQYLLRMRDLDPALDPQLIIVGFSMATDLYDLIPPRLGGFIYGHPWGRVYFDLDADGNLLEIRDLVGKDLPEEMKGGTWSRRIRSVPYQFALYRRFKRSRLATLLAARVSFGGVSFWPGMDTALMKDLDENATYRWNLAGALIEKIAKEAHDGGGRKVVLVNIPYLAQAYDEVWEASFGAVPDKYDRWVGGRRLEALCRKAKIEYVDTTPVFVDEIRRKNTWLHFREDAHPRWRASG